MGSVSLTKSDPPALHPQLTPWVASLFVAASYQGRGIGPRLMESPEAPAESLGFGQLFFFTWSAVMRKSLSYVRHPPFWTMPLALYTMTN